MKKLFVFTLLAASLISLTGRGNNTMKYKMAIVGYREMMKSDPESIKKSRELIDKIVEDGYNTIIVGAFDFMPMWLLDYSKTQYPEAAQFPAAEVNKNRETLRSNLKYARSKGIKWILTRSMSHNVPEVFWKAHQAELNPDNIFDRYLRQAHWANNYASALEGKFPWVIPHQQWTNPTYRNFLLRSTEMVLDQIPEINGFSNNYSEVAWSIDVDKLRAGESARDCRDLALSYECFRQYTDSMYFMLQRKRGDDFLYEARDWYIPVEVLATLTNRPNLSIAVKYGGADQPVVNYPPWAKELVDKGYNVVLNMHLYDAEWPYPTYWYDADFITKVFKNYYSGGFAGFMSLDYMNRGDVPNNPVKLLFQRTTTECMWDRPFTNRDAAKFLEPYFGKASPYIVSALNSVTTAQENYIKLLPHWYWFGDGISITGIRHQGYWMFFDNPKTPVESRSYIRQNVVSAVDYADACAAGEQALAKAEAQWKKEGKITPMEVIALMEKSADDAITAMEQARAVGTPKGIGTKDEKIFKDLIANAYLHKVLVNRCDVFIRSAIHIFMTGWEFLGDSSGDGRKKTKVGVDMSKEFVAELEQYVALDKLYHQLRQMYAPRMKNPGHDNYSGFENMAKLVGGRIDVNKPVDQAELERYVKLIEKK